MRRSMSSAISSPPYFTGEVTAHVVLVLVEQFVGIFVDGIQRTEQVDGDILFHKAFEFKS